MCIYDDDDEDGEGKAKGERSKGEGGKWRSWKRERGREYLVSI